MDIINLHGSRVISLILTLFWVSFFWVVPFGIDYLPFLNSGIANAIENRLEVESAFIKNNFDIDKINFELFNRQTYEINVAKTYYFTNKEDELLEKLRSNGLGDYKSPLKFYKKGIDAMREGNYDAAVRYYTDCIKQPTNFTEAYIARGQAYAKQNNFEKAVADFSHAMNVEQSTMEPFLKDDGLLFDSTKYVDPLIARANVYANQHQYENAITDLDEAIQRNPDFYDAYLAKANVYLDQEKYPEALYQIQIALDYNPEFLAAFLVRGIVNIKQKQYQKAIDNFNQIIKMSDSVEDSSSYLVQTYYSIGFANLMLGENQEAIKYFTETINLDNGFKVAYLERGLAEFDLGQYTSVIQDIDSVQSELKHNPSYEVAYYPLGISYLETKQYSDAKSIFTQIIAKYADSAEIYYDRGLAEFKLRNYEASFDDFNKAISMNYKTPESYFWRGSALSNLNKNEEAVLDYSQVIKLNPKYSEAFKGRGDAYYNLKNYQKAIEDYDKVIIFQSELSSSYLDRGMSYYHLGKWTEGHKDIDKFLNINPDFEDIVKDVINDQIFPLIDAKVNFKNSLGVVSIDINSDNIVASGGWDGSISTWRITDTGLEKLKIKSDAHSRQIRDLKFNPDGSLLVSASNDKTIKLWSTKNISLNNSLETHLNSVTSIAISHNGNLIASGSDDRSFKLWDLTGGNELDELPNFPSYIQDVVFSFDDKFLAVGTSDGKITVWPINKNGEISELAHEGVYVMSENIWGVRALVFTPDSNILISANNDDTIKLWNPETGNLIRTLEGHSDNVTSVDISPDGKLLASGSDDKTVKIWNLETGDEIATLLGHTSYVQDVAFSPDGHFLVSGSNDNTIQVWRMSD